MSKLGYNFVAIVGIQVSMAELRKVWDTLCHNPAVCQLTWVTGRYDLIAVIFARSAVEFSHFMVNELSVIPSVIRTETFVSLGMSKGMEGLADTTELVRRLDASPRKRR
jgi:DNA-binding Lrp family transcriptional regulator